METENRGPKALVLSEDISYLPTVPEVQGYCNLAGLVKAVPNGSHLLNGGDCPLVKCASDSLARPVMVGDVVPIGGYTRTPGVEAPAERGNVAGNGESGGERDRHDNLKVIRDSFPHSHPLISYLWKVYQHC